MEPRPTVTKEMVLKAAQPIAEAIDCHAEDIAEVYSYLDDGFDLCKKLDRRCMFETTREDMEELDNLDWEVRKLLAEAEKEWFEANDIQPPLPIGSMTTIGEITGINEHSVACYEIKLPDQDDSKQWSRRIVKFEDVVAA